MGSIEFVTFHYSVGDGLEAHPNETLGHKEYLKILDMMFSSAALFHPTMRGVVITSADTSLRGLRYPVIKHETAIDPTKLMLSRTRAQQQYLRESSFEAPIVFLDSDILLNGSFSSILEKDFDVALTYRTKSSVPINGGLMIMNNRRPEKTRHFFNMFTEHFESAFSDKANWYGDQLAMVSLLQLEPLAPQYNETIEVDGCRILLLPCDTYNFSPDNNVESIRVPLEDKLVLHFKGQRKHLMRLYWGSFLVANDKPHFWQTIRRYPAQRQLCRLLEEGRLKAQGPC
jgi:hypothetical protein